MVTSPAMHNKDEAGHKRRVTILGATGSIGRSTAAVISEHRDRFRVSAVVGGRDADTLADVARSLGASFAALAEPTGGARLSSLLSGTGIACGAGPQAVLDAVALEADVVVAAIAGTAGLAATVAAVRHGRCVALANKETLVCAGDVVMKLAAASGSKILPLDSEHNAIFQALAGEPLKHVETIVLTASGGPFRQWSKDRIASAGREAALAHPNWSMGPKVTIDSATLMNKGLELIEAHHLFDVEPARLDVLVHPQSAVHGLVYFVDGSVTAGLATPDMRVPIAHCLGWPERMRSSVKRLDLAALGTLTFEKPDFERFPALRLALQALAEGGAMATILNAANEIAVAAFLDGRLDFYGITEVVGATCERMRRESNLSTPQTVDEALAVDHISRRYAQEAMERGNVSLTAMPRATLAG
jgi:1-deoxy-D-xylulose-5-phosphate reductoisomerase